MTEPSIWDRPGLQAERTDLSWMRTSLSLMVNGGLLLLRHNLSSPDILQQIGGGAAFVLALFTLGMARRRQRVLGQRPLPKKLADPTAMILLGAGTTVFGVIELVVLLAPNMN